MASIAQISPDEHATIEQATRIVRRLTEMQVLLSDGDRGTITRLADALTRLLDTP
jgi:hypothetical protein